MQKCPFSRLFFLWVGGSLKALVLRAFFWRASLRCDIIWFQVLCVAQYVLKLLHTSRVHLQIDPLNLSATKNMQHRFIVMRILNTALTLVRSRMWTFLADSYMCAQKYGPSSDAKQDEGWRGNRTGSRTRGAPTEHNGNLSRVYLETKTISTHMRFRHLILGVLGLLLHDVAWRYRQLNVAINSQHFVVNQTCSEPPHLWQLQD